jgi:hypothetical protein
MDNFYFTGIFLIIACIALVVRMMFKGDFPLMKILAGVFFILAGVKIFSGNFSTGPENTGNNEVLIGSYDSGNSGKLPGDHQVVFSRTDFDLADMEFPEEKTDFSLNIVFSGSTVYLPPGIPVNIRVEAVFAGVKMPGRNSPLIGRGTYRSENFDPELPHLNIRVNALFGNIVFMHK